MMDFIASLFNIVGEYTMKLVKYFSDDEESVAPRPLVVPEKPTPWTEKRRDESL